MKHCPYIIHVEKPIFQSSPSVRVHPLRSNVVITTPSSTSALYLTYCALYLPDEDKAFTEFTFTALLNAEDDIAEISCPAAFPMHALKLGERLRMPEQKYGDVQNHAISLATSSSFLKEFSIWLLTLLPVTQIWENQRISKKRVAILWGGTMNDLYQVDWPKD